MRFFILCLFLFLEANKGFATEQDFITWVKRGISDEMPVEENMPYQGTIQENEMLKRILSVPENLKPYLYPMLFESFSSFSKKILTHPEIALFQNEVPELSSEFLRDPSKKTLEFLPPIYYPLFAPKSVRKQIFMFLNKDEG